MRKLPGRPSNFRHPVDIAAYRAHYPLCTRECLVLELALGTAQRRGDLVRLGWRQVVNGAIVLKQNNTAVTVTVPIVSELHAALDLCPRDRLTFIAAAGGRPLGAASLGNEFRDWLRRAGLPDRLSLHGLRKAAARRLAEAGCTTHEIAARKSEGEQKEAKNAFFCQPNPSFDKRNAQSLWKTKGAKQEWSGQQDSNLRPEVPKTSALPDCAMPRQETPAILPRIR